MKWSILLLTPRINGFYSVACAMYIIRVVLIRRSFARLKSQLQSRVQLCIIPHQFKLHAKALRSHLILYDTKLLRSLLVGCLIHTRLGVQIVLFILFFTTFAHLLTLLDRDLYFLFVETPNNKQLLFPQQVFFYLFASFKYGRSYLIN